MRKERWRLYRRFAWSPTISSRGTAEGICGTAGDSILAAFGSALAAVQCAVDIQNELAHSNNALEKDRRMQFRIGINVGDVMLKDGDIFGDGVNIAARLEGLAELGVSASRAAFTIMS
jgi:class 3 adenylate cyclase